MTRVPAVAVAPALIASLVLLLSGCGGSDGGGGDAKAPAATSAPKPSIQITAPQEDDSVSAKLAVSGVVTPGDAEVDVNGEAAQVEDGRFSATVRLDEGDDQVQATAVAPGGTDQAKVAVDRLPTAAEKRAVARRKAAKARKRQAAETESAAAPASDGSFTMPNEVGKDLQAAQDDVQRASGNPLYISRSEDATGEDRFQVLDRDWQVCGQNIAAGQPVSDGDDVVFSVVKAYEDCP